jgi:thioester reductase-like protein
MTTTIDPQGRHTMRKTILLTGASGVVGSALLSELNDFDVHCLVHNRLPDTAVAGYVHGDLSRPRLGLDRRAYRELAGRIDAIVHCAAAVNFNVGAALTDAVNVTGTRHILDLASLAQAPLYHVSTAFVARADAADEEGPGIYISSKRGGDAEVLTSGLPAVLLRPSVVSGDSATGEIARFQGFHDLSGGVMRGFLPLLPVRGHARIDFLPQDVVARCIGDVVRREERHGEYWLTAGSTALRVDRMIELCLAVGRAAGIEPPPPRLVDPEMVDRLIRPVFLPTLPRRVQRQYEHMLSTMGVFYSEEHFPSSLEQLGRAVSEEQLESAFTQTMRYWAEAKELAAAA